MRSRMKGSTALLYLPTRVTCTSTPYFLNASPKNMGSLARPFTSISPKGLMNTVVAPAAR